MMLIGGYTYNSILLSCLVLFFVTKHTTQASVSCQMIEICNNALDDDMDGLIDLNDTDCTCVVIEPVSLIPNPSFEEITCCPSGRSQLRCAESWVQASEPTTDLINACDWLGWEEFPPPMPFPDGVSILGFRDGRVRQLDEIPERNWKEYAGACLLEPLRANTTYRFEFHLGFVDQTRSPPIDITFFGTTDCVNLPFGGRDEAFGCPTNGSNWIELGATNINGGNGNQWVKSFIEVTPTEDINAIVIGPSCQAVDAPMSIYYFFDNLVLSDSKSFDAQIKGVDHPCNANFSLSVGDDSNFDYQWYKDGISLVGETTPLLTQLYGEGDYQVRTTANTGQCRVSLKYEHLIPTFTDSLIEVICPDEVYIFGTQDLSESGIYKQTVKTDNDCDNEITINLTVLDGPVDTIQATIFKGQTYRNEGNSFTMEGEHLIALSSSRGCDSLVVLVLEYYQLFIPNIFSPNDDDTNEDFTIYSADGLIDSIEISIYSRWGDLVYQGTSWDGTKDGSRVDPGLYIYHAMVRMQDGNQQLLSGQVTVVL